MTITSLRQTKIAPIVYSSLANLVGNTPLLPLLSVAENINPKVKIFAKAEWLNPSGSVKDRPALNIILEAIKSGDLDGNIRLLDSTSGNMGIAYGTLCASMGIGVTITMPANASQERMIILRSLGVELILTDPLEGSDGAMLKAQQLSEEFPDKYFYANQYDNPANWQAHYQTTGPEIWGQTFGEVSHFVAGLGTSGTITGVTRFLKEQNSEIKSVAFQPASPFHGLEGLKHMQSSQLPGIYDQELPDENLHVETEKAYEMVRRLAKEEGVFVGISAGAAVYAAIQTAEKLDSGTVVTVLPDAGYKYMSNQIWGLEK